MRAAWLRTLVTVVVGSVGFASAVANAQESVVFAHPSAGEMGFTGFRGISGGRAVGFWNNPEENRSGSFIYDLESGTHMDLAMPGASLLGVTGIAGDKVVGYYNLVNGGPVRGFVHDLNALTWTDVDHPLVNREAGGNTTPYSIGADGTIVGSFVTEELAPTVQGFARDAGGGFRVLNYPGSAHTNVNDVDAGRFVGRFNGGTPDLQDGFLYDGTTWAPLEYPDAESTTPQGIDGNLVVGHFLQKDFHMRGFVYDIETEAWYVYDHPDYFHTLIEGIDGDVVAGSAWRLRQDGEWVAHAFATTIPEPSTVAMLGISAIAATRRLRYVRAC